MIRDFVNNEQMKQICDKIQKKTRVHRWKGIKSFTIEVIGLVVIVKNPLSYIVMIH